MLKRFWIALFLLIFGFTISGCIQKSTIEILNLPEKVHLGDSLILVAQIRPSLQDNGVTWSASNDNAAIDQDGLFTPIEFGEVTVTATSKKNLKLNISQNVTILKNINHPLFLLGERSLLINQEYNYTLEEEVPVLNTTYRWESLTPISLEVLLPGKLKAIAPGQGSLKLTDQSDPSYSITFHFQISNISPTSLQITGPTHLSLQDSPTLFHSSILPVEALQTTLWTSSDPAVATVDSLGYVTPLTTGQTTITATSAFDSSINNSILLTVNSTTPDSITIAGPNNLTLTSTAQYVASVLPVGSYQAVLWTTSDPLIASINSDGQLSIYHTGTIVITATSLVDPNLVQQLSVTIQYDNPLSISIIGPTNLILSDSTASYSASINPLTAHQLYTWSVSDSSVATIEQTGQLTIIQPGTTFVTVVSQINSSITAQLLLTIAFDAPSEIIINGPTELFASSEVSYSASVLPINASPSVQWSTSDETIAQINATTGQLTIYHSGVITITATSLTNSAITQELSLTINPDLAVSVNLLGPDVLHFSDPVQQYTASVLPNTALQTILWESSNLNVATISNTGFLTIIALGETTITASVVSNPIIKKSITVTIIYDLASSITINGSEQLTISEAPGEYQALVFPETAQQSGTWSIIEGGSLLEFQVVAQVLQVTPLLPGTVVIQFQEDNTLSTKQLTITIVRPLPSGISLSSEIFNQIIYVGEQLTLIPVVAPVDADQTVTYLSSAPTIVAVSASGVLTALEPGQAQITIFSVGNLVTFDITFNVYDSVDLARSYLNSMNHNYTVNIDNYRYLFNENGVEIRDYTWYDTKYEYFNTRENVVEIFRDALNHPTDLYQDGFYRDQIINRNTYDASHRPANYAWSPANRSQVQITEGELFNLFQQSYYNYELELYLTLSNGVIQNTLTYLIYSNGILIQTLDSFFDNILSTSIPFLNDYDQCAFPLTGQATKLSISSDATIRLLTRLGYRSQFLQDFRFIDFRSSWLWFTESNEGYIENNGIPTEKYLLSGYQFLFQNHLNIVDNINRLPIITSNEKDYRQNYVYSYQQVEYHGFAQMTEKENNWFEMKLWNGRKVSVNLPIEANWDFVPNYPTFSSSNLIVTYDADPQIITVYGINDFGDKRTNDLLDKYQSVQRSLYMSPFWILDEIGTEQLFLSVNRRYGIKLTQVQNLPGLYNFFTIQLIHNLAGRPTVDGQVPHLTFPSKFDTINTSAFEHLTDTEYLITYTNGFPQISVIFPNYMSSSQYESSLNDLLDRYWINDDIEMHLYHYRFNSSLEVRIIWDRLKLSIRFSEIVSSQLAWPTQKLNQLLNTNVPSLAANPDKFTFYYDRLVPLDIRMEFLPGFTPEIEAYYQYYLHQLNDFTLVSVPFLTLYQNSSYHIELEISSDETSINFHFRTSLTPYLTGDQLVLANIFPSNSDFNITLNANRAYNLFFLESTNQLIFLCNRLSPDNPDSFYRYVKQTFTSNSWHNPELGMPLVYQNNFEKIEITFSTFDASGNFSISVVFL